MNRFVLGIAICVVAGGCTPEPLPPPPPPPPIVTPVIYDLVLIPGGKFLAQQLRCANPFQPNELFTDGPILEHTLPAFKIDRHVATCADYQRCIDAGGCAPTRYFDLECDHGLAVVSYEIAAAYCGWRGARLQSYAQWQRAARGTDGRVYPDGPAPPTECRASMEPDSEEPRCLRTSPTGIEYGTRNRNGEWTRDLDCNGPTHDLFPVVVMIFSDMLTTSRTSVGSAEIRCVREP